MRDQNIWTIQYYIYRTFFKCKAFHVAVIFEQLCSENLSMHCGPPCLSITKFPVEPYLIQYVLIIDHKPLLGFPKKPTGHTWRCNWAEMILIWGSTVCPICSDVQVLLNSYTLLVHTISCKSNSSCLKRRDAWFIIDSVLNVFEAKQMFTEPLSN